MFDAQFGNADVGVGIITDSTNTLVIKGDGNTNWYAWNTYKVGSSDNSSERWDMCTDVAKTDKQTFAVEFDLENTTMTLYVKQSDGTFKFVREVMCYDTEFGELLSSRIGIRNTKTKNTPDETYWAEISNLSIYKGLVYYDVVERVVDDTDEEEDEDNGGSATKPNNNKTETKAPETTAAPETEAEVKSGCGSSVAMTGVALVGTCVAMLAVKRRRED